MTAIGFQLCESYNVDVEKLTEFWLTFCVNNNNDIDPTLDSLVKMENTVLKKDYKLHDLTMENNMNRKQSMDKQGFNANRDTYPLHMYYKIFILS